MAIRITSLSQVHSLSLATLLFATALCLFAVDGIAASVGHVFSVSTGNTSMEFPAVAMNRNGRFVVVWTHVEGWDSDAGPVNVAVLARVYNGAGFPVTNQFVVDTTPSRTHGGGDVAMDDQGNFVVVWVCGASATDPWQSKICKRSFYADGRPMGPELQVSRDPFYNWNGGPSIAMDAQGNYVIAWSSYRTMWPNPSIFGLFGQRFAANGDRIGDEFRIDGGDGTQQYNNVDIAMNNSNINAVWYRDPPNGRWNQTGIVAAQLDALGAPLSNQFEVSAQGIWPHAATLKNGGMVVVWDGPPAGIRARLYDRRGAPIGQPFVVSNIGFSGSVFAMQSGGFGVAYVGGSCSLNCIQVRRFTADGRLIERGFAVSEDNKISTSPAIAFNGEDDFVVVWEYRPVDYGFVTNIHARRYDTGPTVSVVASDALAAEAGRTPGVFTFTRTGSTASSLTVDFSIGGTATSGNDYLSLGSQITFPVGASEVKKRLTPLQDVLQEFDETVTLRLRSSDRYRLGSPASATITLTSDDAIRRTVTVAATDGTATEAGLTTAAYTFTRTGGTAAALTVDYSVGGSAIAGSDYVSLGSSVTFPIGASRVTKILRPLQDTQHESNESVVLRLQQSARYAVDGTGSASVVLTSNE